MAQIPRRQSIPVQVGNVWVGGSHPIRVQSMTNTDTADVALHCLPDRSARGCRLGAGADYGQHPRSRGRCSGNRRSAAGSWDRHADHRRLPLQRAYSAAGISRCARALDKYRINPGNVGMGRQHDDNFRAIIEVANEHGKAVRIGVNWGSLDQSLVTRLMDENAKAASPEGCQ